MPRSRHPRSQPLCEVFGYPVNDLSSRAHESRMGKLCPYNNIVSKCTKVSVENPLGVCSIWDTEQPIIICPVRFREGDDHLWRVVQDVAEFLLPNTNQYHLLREVPLADKAGDSVGKFDAVLVDYGSEQIVDFGALEIQAVYITGNLRDPFSHYVDDPTSRHSEAWLGPKYPGPDWLSSIKRLIRQLTVKGAIFEAWNKRMAIAVQKQFFNRLNLMNNIDPRTIEDGEMGWFVYDLVQDPHTGRFALELEQTIYTSYADAMRQFSTLEAGDIKAFETALASRLAKPPGHRQYGN